MLVQPWAELKLVRPVEPVLVRPGVEPILVRPGVEPILVRPVELVLERPGVEPILEVESLLKRSGADSTLERSVAESISEFGLDGRFFPTSISSCKNKTYYSTFSNIRNKGIHRLALIALY